MLIAFAFCLGVSGPSVSEAKTFRVNNPYDMPDLNPGDGVCQAAEVSGSTIFQYLRCTLRAAIMEANAYPGADIIKLPRLTFALTVMGSSDETDGWTGDLDIRDKVVIEGAGKDLTTIEAWEIFDRIFDVHGPAVVEISGMTLKGGQVVGYIGWNDDNYYTNQEVPYPPQGIQYDELECDPWAQPQPPDKSEGGALLNRGGVVFLKDMMFTENLALCDGGAIASTGDAFMRITKCDFEYNVAISDGGAIENDEDSIMVIQGSKFKWNNAYEDGGAIANEDSMMKIKRSRLLRNSAQELGGGLWNGDSDPVSMLKTRIKNNDAQDGGGIWNNDGFMTLREMIVENNSPNDIVDYNIEEGLYR